MLEVFEYGFDRFCCNEWYSSSFVEHRLGFLFEYESDLRFCKSVNEQWPSRLHFVSEISVDYEVVACTIRHGWLLGFGLFHGHFT